MRAIEINSKINFIKKKKGVLNIIFRTFLLEVACSS